MTTPTLAGRNLEEARAVVLANAAAAGRQLRWSDDPAEGTRRAVQAAMAIDALGGFTRSSCETPTWRELDPPGARAVRGCAADVLADQEAALDDALHSDDRDPSHPLAQIRRAERVLAALELPAGPVFRSAAARKAFADGIRSVRLARGLSIRRAAELAGVSPGAVVRAEDAGSSQLVTVARLAEAYDIPIGDLPGIETLSSADDDPRRKVAP